MDLVAWSHSVEGWLRRPPLIRCNGKRPLDTEWTTGPWDDPDHWRALLEGHQGNVGCLTGRGVLVIDVDSYKVGAEDAFDALVSDTGLSTDTVVAITGGGGRQYWYSYDESLHVPSIPLEPLGYVGIDLKADGGQVVIEPSVHPDTGRPYSWEHSAHPETVKTRRAVKGFLAAVGVVEGNRRRRPSRHWQPLDGDSEINERDRDAVNLLIERFGGHDPVVMSNGVIGIWRPDKDTGSASATVGYIGPGLAKVWSSRWSPFESGVVYDLGQLREMAGLGPIFHIPDAVEIPEGYRLWREGDDVVAAPTLSPAAYHGLLGVFLRHVEGNVEAHPAAIGAHLIPCFGTFFGRHIAYTAGPDLQHPKLYFAVVGPTSSGGKGAAMNVAMVLVNAVDSQFLKHHSIAGIGSGETLIWEMRDTTDKEDATEKRRIVLDAELSRVLRVVRREGSILGDVLRTAFDSYPLRHSTRKDKVTTSSGHHLSIVGSITPGELRALTEQLAMLNGFANRYLYVWSEIPLLLPFGGEINRDTVTNLAKQFAQARKDVLERIAIGESRLFTFDTEARSRWEGFYAERRRGIGDTEAMKAITSRQVAHAARIALIYAALDGADHIELDHLDAGIAWADYSLGTVHKVFTSGPSGRVGQLLASIREKGAEGLDGAGQDLVFGKNLKAGELAELREDLEIRHLIVTARLPSGGRPRIVSYAITPLSPTEKRING
jgi:hypothetical protein